MEPLKSKHEARIQLLIQQHRLPYDPAAWAQMEALLDQANGTGGTTLPPTNGQRPTELPRWWLWLLLLPLLFTLAALSWQGYIQGLQASRAEARQAGAENLAQPAPQPGRTMHAPTPSGAGAGQTGAFAAEGLAPEAPSLSQAPVGSSVNPKDGSAFVPQTGSAAVKASRLAAGFAGQAVALAAAATAPLPTWVATEAKAAPDAAETARREAELLEALPGCGPAGLALPQPSLQPIDPLYATRQLRRGWALGGNFSMVDYRSGRTSALPMFGYYWNFPFRQGQLQAEAQFKAVGRYQQTADFRFVAPGFSQSIELELRSLVFLEFPLSYKWKRARSANQYWLIGCRPSFNFIYRSASTNSISIGGPTSGFGSDADIEIREGIRWFDLGLTAGWEWRFSPRWALDLRYTQGWNDMTHDNFFKRRDYVLNSDLQITFRHYVSPRQRSGQRPLFPDGARPGQ
jgi:hypothetical protein